MKIKRNVFIFAILIGLFLTVTGCADDSPANGLSEGDDGEPQDGGTLRMGFGAEDFKDTLIPGLANDAFNQNMVRMLFDPLAQEDGELELNPRLAEDWEVSSDNKSMTVTLNEDAAWSDGEPVTADDVLFSFNAFASPDMLKLGGDGGSDLSTIKGYEDIQEGEEESFEETGGFEKISDTEFKINLNEKDAFSIANILTNRPIPKHILEDDSIEDWEHNDLVQKPDVTSGPYSVKEVKKPTTVIMDKNEDYYGDEAHISEIVVEAVDSNIAPGLFAEGKLDYMMKGFNVSDVDDLKGIDSIDVISQPGDVFEYVGMKLYKPEFEDVDVRKALMYALPREDMMTAIYKDNGELLDVPITEIIGTHATEDDGVEKYKQDLDKAEELLDEAGWEKDSEGNRIDPETDDPAQINLIYGQDKKTDQSIAESIESTYDDIGIEVTLSPQDSTTYSDKLQNDDEEIDMWIGAWGDIGDDPRGLWATGEALNWPRWEDEKNDDLIEKTFATDDAFDEDKQKDALIEWQKYVNDQLPVLFLWTPNDVAVKNKNLHIPEEDLIDVGSVYNPQDWWLSE